MNQILSVDNTPKNKRKKGGPADLSKIVRFFAIAIIIFGIFMIGSGTYAMYKNQSGQTAKVDKPEINSQEISDTQISLSVRHSKTLETMVYYWNDEQETTIRGNGRNYIEETLDLPSGTNTLNVIVTDVNGEKTEFSQEFTRQSDISIKFEVSGNNIVVLAEGISNISYMTYRWDNEEEKKIDVNNTTAEQTIEIPKGLHTLTVAVVDENNNTETKTQEINGVTKPKVEVTTDGAHFTIIASDESTLTRMEIVINQVDKYKLDLNHTELEYEFPYELQPGENKIEVTVYNSNDASETFKAKVTI